MALSDHDIVITPNKNQEADPILRFTGGNATVANSVNVSITANGTLSFSNSSVPLVSVNNPLTSTVFSVNNISGNASIEVTNSGVVRLARLDGNVGIGTATVNAGVKLAVFGGNIQLGTSGRAIEFPDGTRQTTAFISPVAVNQGGTGLTAGTAGGVLYYSATGTLTSSGALAASALIVGGGASGPSTITTGTGVVTALGINTGTAGAFVVNGGALGTPSSGTLTNCTFPTLNQNTTGYAAGIAGGTLGQLVYQTAANTTGFVGVGTSGWMLTGTGAALPQWTLATNANTASTIVQRDTSGNFSAGTITASLTGTASTATNVAGGTAGQIHYQSGAGATAFVGVGTSGWMLTGTGAALPQWTLATNANTASTIVQRDASGNFTAGTITASLSGTASTATNLAGGSAGALPVQTSAGATSFITAGASGTVLTGTGSTPAYSASPTLTTSLTVPTMIGGTAASSSLTLQSTSGAGTSDSIVFKVGNAGVTTAMTVNTSGNVGIGTSSFSNLFTVYSSSSTNDDDLIALGFTSFTPYATIGTHNVDGTAGGIKFSTKTSNTLFERMRIDAEGDVGIGTATIAAGTRLYVSGGNVRIGEGSNNVGILFSDGTYQRTAASTISPGGTTGAIQYNSGSAFAGNAGVFFFDSVTNRVGIGTNTVSASTLAVKGDAPAWFNTTNSGAPEIVIGTSLTTGTVLGQVSSATYGYIKRQASDASPIIAFTNTGVGINNVTAPINALDVSGGVVIGGGIGYAGTATAPSNGLLVQGSVGIGTTSSGERLSVVQNQNASTRIAISNQDSGTSAESVLRLSAFGAFWDIATGSTARNTNALTIGVSGTERMRITSGGLVGIGTNNPDINLRVFGAASQIGTLDATVDTRISSLNASSVGIMGTYSNHGLVIFTNGTERLRIDNNGNLAFGTITPLSNFYVSKNLTGTYPYGICSRGTVLSDVTGTAIYYDTGSITQANTFTLGNLIHYRAFSFGLGAGSSVTNQYGFIAPSGTEATTNFQFYAGNAAAITTGKTNYAFYADNNTATGGGTTWNIYAAGTANNYFAGNVSIGTSTIATGTKLGVWGGNIRIGGATFGVVFPDGSWQTSAAVTAVSGTSGRITSSGGLTPSIDLASGVITPMTATGGISVITVDTYGRVTAVTGSAGYLTSAVTSITAGTGLSGGTITSTGTISLPNTGPGAGSYSSGISAITIDAQGRITAITGSAGYVTSSGVTSITAGTGLSGGTITSTGTISLPNTGPGAGSYSSGISAITVDAQGRITAITGSAGYATTGQLASYLPLAGGTLTGRVIQSTTGFGVAVDDTINVRVDSGFWETSNAQTSNGWPESTGTWYHLLTSTHSNLSNYYSMQFAGSFYDSNALFYRATNASGTTAWNKVWHAGNDGAGSGLDADLLDGQQGSFYYPASNPSGYVTSSGVTSVTANAPLTSSGGTTPAISVDTNGSMQIGSLGVGTPASGTSGEIRATNNVTAYYSDRRLKKILSVIESPIEKIKQLSGVIYQNNDVAKKFGYTDDNEQVGVIAQEVEKVLPQIVKRAPFDTEFINGKEISKSGEEYKTVQYEKLIPLLIESIKEQQQQIDELKGIINNFINANKQ